MNNKKEIVKKIELVQGDTSHWYSFRRKNENGETIKTLPQKMWITFKRNSGCDDALFQKTLGDGITFDGEYYKFRIMPDDTCNLPYGNYGFDIAIINEAGEKKTLKKDGELEIVDHYTKKCNEV